MDGFIWESCLDYWVCVPNFLVSSLWYHYLAPLFLYFFFLLLLVVPNDENIGFDGYINNLILKIYRDILVNMLIQNTNG